MGDGRNTIFLVDDDVTNLTIGKNTLAEFYNVFTFNSGTRLLKTLEKSIPDLILLDVEMPEMNGYEVIQLMKKSERLENIPVIFLTARRDSESEMKGLSLGAIDYIIKPFSPPLLLKRLEVHLLVESQKKALIDYNNNLEKMVEEKTRTVVELKNAVLKTIAELVEFRDDVTGKHIERTQSYLSTLITAAKDGLYKDEIATWDIDLVLQSAQLHDLGKIAIRDNILLKPDRLTEIEFEKIKEHTIFGEKVIDKIKLGTTEREFLEQARILAVTHHEKWDGSGYPHGLKGHKIPLQGRLMAIADVYDALVSDRPYKKAVSHQEAVDIILADKGKHFDPELVDIFLSVADEFHEITMFYQQNHVA
ncbi:MAG: response regulator [Sporomusaceae bacterium]|jgi:putative two-component system response regulator|nr:response regulator [Sporomusaceae bacterium]